MANITLLGASYTDVPAVDLPQTGGGTVRFYENGGGSSGYTRTVIAPQQTVTPDSSRQAVLSGVTVGFVDASHYIVTLDGVEWYGTCETLWGTNLAVGEAAWFWSDSGDYVYPFGAIYISDEGLTVAFADTNQHTIKVEKLELTGSGGSGDATLITKTITANGTYSAEDDDADGYSEVTVNVPSSAASSWTKIAETTYQVSTTSTSAATVATWATGHSEIWTSNKMVYVRIRDTAGARNGYCYGSDNFFINNKPVNDVASSSSSFINGVRQCHYINADGDFGTYGVANTSGYGVYADYIYGDGRIRVRQRYNNSYSLTINSTYKVEVYLLDPPTGAPIFE